MSTMHSEKVFERSPAVRQDVAPVDTRPLRVLFVITSMEVGGAETLLVNLIRRLDPDRMLAQVACLKQPGELGTQLSNEIDVHSQLLRHKFDFGVVRRLRHIMVQQRIDAVVTVGAGDKMFWGRLAARWAGVPVIVSALHSTGWPDGLGRLNRMLTSITDGFIAVAQPHGKFLVEFEKLPRHKVHVIPNGIDTHRFVFDPAKRRQWRSRLEIPVDSAVCGIVAALRPEKNHELFLSVAGEVHLRLPSAHFVIVGDGAERQRLQNLRDSMVCRDQIHLVGNTHDVPGALSMMDLFALTSHNEASPVSILEAMSCGLPVVAPRVGSIDQAVLDDQTGFVVDAGDADDMRDRWLQLLQDPTQRRRFSQAARKHVEAYGSIDVMTRGYTDLIESLYRSKLPA